MLKKTDRNSKRQDNSSTQEPMPKPSVLKKNKFFSFKNLLVFLTVFLLVFIIFFTNRKVDGIFVKNYLGLFSDFVLAPVKKVQSTEGKTNILILGKSGEGYTAPDLTDTIMFVSISLDDPSVKIVSLPRDIWIPEIRAKLNSAYYWGKQKENNGFSLINKIVEEILGKDIHYTVVFDFSSFVKIVDVLEGVEVDVERDFTDEKYPIAGKEDDLCDGDKNYKCRYETIEFKKGKNLMDGETALKFVRSRNASGEEGTDIARGQRQQRVIVAVKNRVLSFETLLNPKKIWEVWNVLKETVETNIDESSAVVIARKIFDAREKIESFVIPEDFFINPPVSLKYDNQYVFIPKNGSFMQLREWVEDLFR